MIPESLQNKLLYELLPDGNASTQTTHLKGQLCALVDMVYISKEQRQHIQQRFAGRLHPLIVEKELEQITPLSATLIEASATDWEGQHRLIDELNGYNSDVISVWITSTLSTPELASHLRQAAFVYEEVIQPPDWNNYAVEQKGEQRYLLRYYDPLITPILYGEAPDDWQQWFFAPIMSWWFAHASTQQEGWHQIIGGAKKQISSAPKLMLTEQLKLALEHDPLPYTILDFLEREGTARFNSSCQGVRIAQVKQYIQDAQKQGFTRKGDIGEYVWLSFHYPMLQITTYSSWAMIKRQTLSGQGRLKELVQRHI